MSWTSRLTHLAGTRVACLQRNLPRALRKAVSGFLQMPITFTTPDEHHKNLIDGVVSFIFDFDYPAPDPWMARRGESLGIKINPNLNSGLMTIASRSWDESLLPVFFVGPDSIAIEPFRRAIADCGADDPVQRKALTTETIPNFKPRHVLFGGRMSIWTEWLHVTTQEMSGIVFQPSLAHPCPSGA